MRTKKLLPLISHRPIWRLWQMAVILIVTVFFISPFTIWGQNGRLDEHPSLKSAKTIMRPYGNSSQIIYSEDPDDSVTVYFILADSLRQTMRTAKIFDGPDKEPHITDFKIVDDTVFLCGYAVIHMGLNFENKGFIGYFCIPDFFRGSDNVHLLIINHVQTLITNRLGSFRSNLCFTMPQKLEVFETNDHKGKHVICMGRCGNSWQSSISTFLADIVHEYRTDDWWYYYITDQLIEGNSNYCDFAVTDNYIVATLTKEGNQIFYLNVYPKPNSVGRDATQEGFNDPQIFGHSSYIRGNPCYRYFFRWTDGLENNLPNGFSIDNYLNIQSPKVIQTNGDTVALAYLTSAYNGNWHFGATVKCFAIPNLLRVPSFYRVDVTPSLSPNVLTQDIDQTLAATGPTNLTLGITADSNRVHLIYNRMIDQWDTYMAFPSTSFPITDLIYNKQYDKLYLLQHKQYPTLSYSDDMTVDEFSIKNPYTPVVRRRLDHTHINTLSKGGRPDQFCIAGHNTDNRRLQYGTYKEKTDYETCLPIVATVPTFWAMGFLNNIRNAEPHVFEGIRVNPINEYSISVMTPAFNAYTVSATIMSNPIENICIAF